MNTRLIFFAYLAATWLLLVQSTAVAANWPSWRGPSGNGECTETEFPAKWTNTEGVKWRTELPGPGNSTPIVWGDKVIVSCASEKGAKRGLLCFNRADGKLIWKSDVEFNGTETTHKDNPYCASTPITDGERIVVWHGSAGLFCYDMAGKLLWERKDLGEFNHIWGNASTPVFYKNTVIAYMGPGTKVFIAAFDKQTGKDVWHVDLPDAQAKTPQDFFGAWASPVIREYNGKNELLMPLPKKLAAFNPDDGKVIWTCEGLGPLAYNNAYYSGDTVVAMSGYMGPAIGLKDGGNGDVTETHRLWRIEKGNPQRVGSGVAIGEHIYILNDSGEAQCFEIKTGKDVWKEKISGSSWSSMVHAGDKLYVIDMKGNTYVLRAAPKFELLSTNPIGELTRSSLALSDGQIFIRTYQNLYCISK